MTTDVRVSYANDGVGYICMAAEMEMQKEGEGKGEELAKDKKVSGFKVSPTIHLCDAYLGIAVVLYDMKTTAKAKEDKKRQQRAWMALRVKISYLSFNLHGLPKLHYRTWFKLGHGSLAGLEGALKWWDAGGASELWREAVAI